MIHAQYLEVDGVDAFVEQWGDLSHGHPVLCVHTAGQSGVQWRHVAPGLTARGFRVIVPDLPGHGRSAPAPGGPIRDLSMYGAWCAQLLQRLALPAPFVVGCSIGGKIALDLAIRCGPTLSGVVAMAADAGMPKAAGAAMVRGLERELEDSAAPSRSDRTFLGTLAVVGRAVAPGRAERIAAMHRREDPLVSNSDLIGWARFDRAADLPNIRCPVHLVVGRDDLWLDTENVRRTAAQIPGARCTVLEGIGHYPMEELEAGAETIASWLQELHGGPRHG
jgi:pimeloyl-ACP methyl ester carboxylesterase